MNSNKTIFITGTNSGFGKATVELFASYGWNVAATFFSEDKIENLFSNLSNVKVYELDVRDFTQVVEVSKKVISDFGKIDAVVNNAGYCLMGPTETSTMEQIKRQFDTNIFGVFAVTKAFIPHFRENKDGIFINIASASAQFSYPFLAAYGASKWAVRGMTESLGIELAQFNIEVKAIYPGLHGTKIFTKLDDGTDSSNLVFQFYKKTYDIFNSAQTSITHITAPSNIANEIYKAVTNRNGPLHIISGGDAKLYVFLKKVIPERVFQKMQIRSITKPMSKREISFFKWLMGKNVSKLEVGSNKK